MCLGIPGQIVSITDAGRKLAMVDVAGVQREINIACVIDEQHPIDACIEDWVLVHVGFAMARVDADEAARTLELLTELGEVREQLREMSEAEVALLPAGGKS